VISSIKGYLKFFVKVYIIARMRSWLLWFFGKQVNKGGWEKRMLIVHLEGLGDSVALTSILKHYKKDFPDKEIYLVLNASSGIYESEIFGGVIQRVLCVDYRRFVTNPFYGLRFINELRRIGFKTVITHDPSLAEISGKFIIVGVGAEKLIGYDGAFFQRVTPFDENMKMGVAYVRRNLLPRFTQVISSADNEFDFRSRKPLNYILHYIRSYEMVSEKTHDDYSPILHVPSDAEESVLKLLLEHGISLGKYCLLSLSTSTPHREWPAERFAEALSAIKSLAIPLVIAGGERDVELIPRFQKIYGGDFLNVAGKTSVPEYIALVRHSLFSFSNETAQAHIAIALKKPSLAILGGGHFGFLSLYGYHDITKWAYGKNTDCLRDNWRCIHTVGSNDPAPCIEVISVEEIVMVLRSLINYISNTTNYPREPFRIESVQS
jgi:ADP-heptose:LPS heptosyltransferase